MVTSIDMQIWGEFKFFRRCDHLDIISTFYYIRAYLLVSPSKYKSLASYRTYNDHHFSLEFQKRIEKMFFRCIFTNELPVPECIHTQQCTINTEPFLYFHRCSPGSNNVEHIFSPCQEIIKYPGSYLYFSVYRICYCFSTLDSRADRHDGFTSYLNAQFIPAISLLVDIKYFPYRSFSKRRYYLSAFFWGNAKNR